MENFALLLVVLFIVMHSRVIQAARMGKTVKRAKKKESGFVKSTSSMNPDRPLDKVNIIPVFRDNFVYCGATADTH